METHLKTCEERAGLAESIGRIAGAVAGAVAGAGEEILDDHPDAAAVRDVAPGRSNADRGEIGRSPPGTAQPAWRSSRGSCWAPAWSPDCARGFRWVRGRPAHARRA